MTIEQKYTPSIAVKHITETYSVFATDYCLEYYYCLQKRF